MSAMKRLFQLMAEKKASDIFMSVSSPINIKINGTSVPVNQQVMDSDTIIKLLYEVLTEKQKKRIRGHARIERRLRDGRNRRVPDQRLSAEEHAGSRGALHSG